MKYQSTFIPFSPGSLTVEEAIDEISSTPRFEFELLKDARLTFYLLHATAHAGGVITLVMVLPTYLNEASEINARRK